MLLGDLEQAWRESDFIAAHGRAGPGNLWDGTPLCHNRILIRCLHGFGDTIQFIRYAAVLRQQVAEIIVESPPELVALLRRQPFIDRVMSWDEGGTFSAWDQQIEVMELPRVYRTTVATIPADVPYLFIREDDFVRSSQAIAWDTRPRIGLVWSASDWNPLRNVSLSALEPLMQIQGVSFYSFQHGKRRGDLYEAPFAREVCDTWPITSDILDTAATLLHMNLLISVDTMAAHLAGALGLPVWTLLPYQADWRWMADTDASPWYPKMRLFRQCSPGDWSTPIASIAAELRRYVDCGLLNS